MATPPGARIAKVTNILSVFPNLSVGNNLILGRDDSWLDWLSSKRTRLARLRTWSRAQTARLALSGSGCQASTFGSCSHPPHS